MICDIENVIVFSHIFFFSVNHFIGYNMVNIQVRAFANMVHCNFVIAGRLFYLANGSTFPGAG